MLIKEPEKFRQNIINKFTEIIKCDNISKNLERGIFNYSIQEARKQKIIRKWNNCYFVRIYISKLHRKTIFFFFFIYIQIHRFSYTKESLVFQ